MPDYGERSSDYAKLYVQDGLVGCYMAYSLESVVADALNDTLYLWKNQVKGGEDAVLYGASYWRSLAGGIGYQMTITEYEADAEKVGCILPFDPEEMTAGISGFYMESVMAYDGVTNEDGTRYVSVKPTYSRTKSAFRFGVLSAMSFVTDSAKAGESSVTRWYLTKRAYDGDYHDYILTGSPLYHPIGNQYAFDYMPTNFQNKIIHFSCASHINDSGQYYDFCLRYGLSAFDKREDVLQQVGSAKYDQICEDVFKDQAGKLSLFNGYPGRLYSVRVYESEELTDREKMRNYFVDLLAFYGVNVSELFFMSNDRLNTVLTNCGVLAVKHKIALDVNNYSESRNHVIQILNSYL